MPPLSRLGRFIPILGIILLLLATYQTPIPQLPQLPVTVGAIEGLAGKQIILDERTQGKH
ncbi:hypothetical protein [uncultured Vagococcus sp.]|uniref:hypothetical protein n=1 Tax=uncultured Vagococcus sp. TaxID=189676 RepID=UPI0028D0FFD2|nr:hypothetical protein [uncultured Vagococcus sp.]